MTLEALAAGACSSPTVAIVISDDEVGVMVGVPTAIDPAGSSLDNDRVMDDALLVVLMAGEEATDGMSPLPAFSLAWRSSRLRWTKESIWLSSWRRVTRSGWRRDALPGGSSSSSSSLRKPLWKAL
jgi:hypothetical protein